MSYDNFLKRLDEEIARRTSFMNNTKWKKLAELLDEENINGLKIKFLLEENQRNLGTLGYVGENYFDTMIGGFYFKEIEWVFIPKLIEIERLNRTEKLSPKIIQQDIDSLEQKLNALGQFHYEKSEDGLKIYAYI